MLAACYHNSLELATQHGFRAIAFPAISTGVYHFPIDRAAGIAVHEVARFLESEPRMEKVIFACFSEDAVAAHEAALDGLAPE